LIHPTAIVDPTASIDKTATIGPYCVIGPEVQIGADTQVASHVVVNGPTKIGVRNRLFQFASIGDDPQDLKYGGERTFLEIGDDNVIREYATMNRGTEGGGGVTRVGSNNLFMAYTHVAHDCQVGNFTVFANGSSLAGHVVVGDYAILAGFSCVHQFCHVGEHAFVGLNSVANKDVAPYLMVVGNYAEAKGINKAGLRRRGFSDQTISALHRAYLQLIRQRGDRQQAVANLSDELTSVPEVQRLIDFIAQSERGIVR